MGGIVELSTQQWFAINEIAKLIHTAPMESIQRQVTASIRETNLVAFSHCMYHFAALVGEEYIAFEYGSIDISPDQIELYQSKFEAVDYINWYADAAVPRVYRDTDIIPNTVRESSVMMRHWMQPNGIFYSAGITIASEKPYGNIYFFRSKDEGDFTNVEMEALGVVNDHLCIRFAREFPSGIPRYLFEQPTNLPLATRFNLTEREVVILLNIRDGCLRKNLPGRLCISENTLKKHLANIYHKTHTGSYEELIQLIRTDESLS